MLQRMKKALKFFELVYRMVKPVVRNKDNLEAEEEPGVDLGQVVCLERNSKWSFDMYFDFNNFIYASHSQSFYEMIQSN